MSHLGQRSILHVGLKSKMVGYIQPHKKKLKSQGEHAHILERAGKVAMFTPPQIFKTGHCTTVSSEMPCIKKEQKKMKSVQKASLVKCSGVQASAKASDGRPKAKAGSLHISLFLLFFQHH